MAARRTPNKTTPFVDGHILTIPPSGDLPLGGEDHTDAAARIITLDTPEWFRWLAQTQHFYVIHPAGNFFCRKEHNGRGAPYWVAQRRTGKVATKGYLGKDEVVTSTALDIVARALVSQDHVAPQTTPALA